MRFTRLLLSTLIILLMLFSFNNPTFGGTFREISVDLAKTAAFSYVRQFYGDVSFYSVEPYYDIDGKVAVYEFILAFDDFIPPSMNLLKSEINMGNAQIVSLQRETQSIKHLNVNGKEKKIKLTEIQNQINEIKERTCFQDTFVTVLTGATDEHVPIIKCHRGLPERLIRSNGTENSQNFSSGSKRIYYTGMFDQFYELSSSRLINIGTGEIRTFSDIRSEVLQNRKNSELTQEKKSLLKEKWQSIENIYRSDSTQAKPEFNTDKGYELIGNESFTTKAVTASAQLYDESLPNLLPYTFTGWDDKIVVSTQKGVYTNTNPTQYQIAYISVSWGNMGSANAGSHKIYIYYDNSLIKCYELAQLATRYTNAMIDLQVIFIQSGQHTLKLVVDKDNQVKESNENDNVYERQIYIQSGNNEGIIKEIPEVPGYNQVDNDCGPVSASKVLAYWDDHPYNGVTYWNLVDHGDSDTGDVSPVEEHPENTGLVADLRRAAGWTHNGGISDLSLKNGILSVCNDSTYGNNLNFTVYRDDQSDYSIIKSEIDNSRPLLYAVQDHPIYEDHFVTVIGYRDSPTYKMVRVKDNWVGNLVQEIDWTESNTSIIRMTPGGTPSDNYENDDSLAQAKEIYPDDPYKFRQTHNFYKSGDVDYVKFAAQVQRRYIIETKNPGNQSHPSIQLLDSGGNIIATDNSRILWDCQNSSNSPLYVKFQDTNNSSGAQTNYDVEVSWEPIEQSQSPQIYVTPSSLTFNALVNDSNPAPQKINIKNTGSDILNWTINDDATWLSCTPIGGSCTNETDEVTVSVNTTGLTSGTYKANITVNAVGASNNPQTVKVTLNIDSSTPVNLSIMAVAGLNGIITPSGNIQLAYGSSQTFSITPNTGYHIEGVSVDGASVGAVKTYTFTNVTSNHTISATFEIDSYTLTAVAGANGSISPSGTLKVAYGGNQTFSIILNTGYHITNVIVDGASVGAVTTYTFTNVRSDHTISVTFEINTYTLTATAGPNGSISPSGTLRVTYGGSQTFSITPNTGYHISDVRVDGVVSVGTVAAYTFTNVTANHTINATFEIDTYTLTATIGPNGSISPLGKVKVNHGSNQTFSIIPATGYHVIDVSVDGASVGTVTTYTFTNVTANHTISTTFDINTYVLTAMAGVNGNISPSDKIKVNHGSNQTFSITPDTGYHIAGVSVDGVSVGAVATYTFTNVASDHTISTAFEINTYILTAKAGANGNISPSEKVNHGDSHTFSITTDTGYHIVDVNVDGASVGTITEYTFTNVTANHTIDAVFGIDTYVLTATAEDNGSISPSGKVTVNYGSNQTYKINPNIGYHIADVSVDGVSVGALTEYSFTNVTSEHAISVTFEINTYTLTATAGANGNISPSEKVNHGDNHTFSITTNTGYHIADVKVNGVFVGIVTEYTFKNVTANHTISVDFEIDTYTLTATAGSNVSISPSDKVKVNHGSNQTFLITPNTGYHVVDVIVDSASVGAVTSYTFTNVTSEHTIAAISEINSYTLTATAGDNGNISPSGTLKVKYGSNIVFSIIPDKGAKLVDLVVDGKSIGPIISYMFTFISADHTISTVFRPAYVKGDVNGDGVLGIDDAILILKMLVKLIEPTPQQAIVADLNNDGEIKLDDAIIILQKVDGFGAPDKDAYLTFNGDVCVTLGEVYGSAGKSIIVPLEIDNANVLSGGKVCISYDSSVLHAVDVLSDSGVLMASNANGSGILHIAFANADMLRGKIIARIKFDVINDSTSPIAFKNVELYKPDASPVSSKVVDGKFKSWSTPPEHSFLLQNYPNPFNPETWIPYQLKEDSEVTIRIYNVTGELIREFRLGHKPVGLYVSQDRAVHWDGTNNAGDRVSSGVYFYNIQAGSYSSTKKMIVVQ